MTLIGNRAEWVLAMLACFRIGAVALPCNTAASTRRPRPPGHGRRPGAGARRGALARAAPRRRRLHGPRRDRRDPRRGAPAGSAGDAGRPRPRRSGTDRLHLGNDRRRRRPRSTRSGTCSASASRRSAGSAPAPASWHGAPRPPAGRSRRGTRSSHPGWRARPPICTRAASTPTSGSGSASARASTCSVRRRPSTGCSPSGPSCGRSARCGGWSAPASRSTPG